MKNEAKRADEGSHELGQQTIREQVEFWDRSRLVFCKDTEDVEKELSDAIRTIRDRERKEGSVRRIQEMGMKDH